MSLPAIARNNHYVPCMYLKRFASRPGYIQRYDLLVPHKDYPEWREKPIDRVGSAMDLYTSFEDDVEADTQEKWFNAEYESPAEDAMERAVSGKPMTREHWRRLVNFLAAQDIRTPARLQDAFRRWHQEGTGMMDDTLKESVERLKAVRASGLGPEPRRAVEPGFPMRVLIRPSTDPKMAQIKVETIAGRSRWLWEQRHILNGIANRLHDHRWTLLKAPDGLLWPTSDNPVVKLNFHSAEKYDFKGGWGSEGTEIFMPIDPRTLLYTRIGHRRPNRATQLDWSMGQWFVRFLREHAFRHIFSSTRDRSIPHSRPRRVDLDAYQHEQKEWAKFNQEQISAETKLNRPLPGG